MTEQYDYDALYERHPLAEEVAALDRRAMAARKGGRLEEALELAQESVRLADSQGVSLFWRMRPHARLASWLTQSGRPERALELCREWLARRRHPGDRVKIYDAMRLALQKQKRHREALVYSVCAILSYFDAIRHREELLSPLMHDGPLAANLRSALGRAKLAGLAEPLHARVLRLHEEGGQVTPERVEVALREVEQEDRNARKGGAGGATAGDSRQA
jgi:tetratricopeptide (TPR) repeat protein